MGDDYIPLLERVNRRIADKMQIIANQLTAGMAQDHSDYKRKVGQIRGLADAKEYINEELKKERNYD